MLDPIGTRGRILLLVLVATLPAIGIAAFVAFAEESIPQAIAAGVAVMGLLLVAAWYGVGRFVLMPLRVLLDTTRRVQEGDYAARTNLPRGREELSQLGSALDEMAARLEAKDAELQRVLAELREQAMTDPLTGLYNRRYFSDALNRELAKASRTGGPVSVILMDLDLFKKVNDTWGHAAGDAVLKAVGALIRKGVRGSDIAARHGGEEFAMLMPQTSGAVVVQRAEAMRREIEAMEVAFVGENLRVSASFGVAEGGAHTASPADLMTAVDEALYAAKAAGRNQVVLSGAPPGERIDARPVIK
ncbi:MAG: diguanylate cyclase [Pseudomonadota bacterium]